MGLKKLKIKNYKSLTDLRLDNLKSFCAFVGPNASGKSNIFEAIEFSNYVFKYSFEAPSFFGGRQSIYSFNPVDHEKYEFKAGGQNFFFEFDDNIRIEFSLHFFDKAPNDNISIGSIKGVQDPLSNQLYVLDIRNINLRQDFIKERINRGLKYENDYEQYVDNFSRIFIRNSNLLKIYGSPPPTSSFLNSDGSNLPQVLSKILQDQTKQNEFIEWLRILIPEFNNIEIVKSNIGEFYDFNVYEKGSTKPFPKNLISDGTNNILALMAVVYQSDYPQFICIEEPENGLHPQAIKFLVEFFRDKCEKNGHTIWLNTHSPSLVRNLNVDEIILVNKIEGQTKVKQLTKEDNLFINNDEAWLSNAFGGGVLW